MITIWGRANSVNVQKVLWLCDELALPYNRIDAGLRFGRNTEADYLAMNPMGKIPTLVDDDFVLWESNSILRYLVMQYGGTSPLYPPAPKTRASIDRWLDWTLSTLQPAERPVFWGIIRTPEGERDSERVATDVSKVAAVWKVLDAQLEGRDFVEGRTFTIADIVLGAFAKRWFGLPGVEREPMPNLERWYALLARRSGFNRYVDLELS
ncbi:glutathione S-transferase [Burkholderia contaminans]|uniref:glutathione S-transferase family protein n=1 Tax=Burkholderia contaminans TaxID=488447 RepID=UPI001CF2F5B6|nr:glutathione S-transferase [Burkholderia contaminans]MCA7915328.1 glutathione S-transferase [Burkholderia contaminans]MCA8101833.1 glutathione S-transferase [Burkholderia contaminans]UUX42006.1 glutathione S-transferase [Burkholderia contaminans]